VVRLLHRAVERHQRAVAGASGVTGGRGGGVAVIHRFHGSADLNVHVHALIFDGVFARTTAGPLRFHAAPPPSATDVAEIPATIVRAGPSRLDAGGATYLI
jgi:hypothetical protein